MSSVVSVHIISIVGQFLLILHLLSSHGCMFFLCSVLPREKSLMHTPTCNVYASAVSAESANFQPGSIGSLSCNFRKLLLSLSAKFYLKYLKSWRMNPHTE